MLARRLAARSQKSAEGLHVPHPSAVFTSLRCGYSRCPRIFSVRFRQLVVRISLEGIGGVGAALNFATALIVSRFAPAVSTYLHDHEGLAERIGLAGIDVPIFMAHGLADQVLPFAWAVAARETLRALNCNVEWREYDMGHELCPQEIAQIADWLNRIFR